MKDGKIFSILLHIINLLLFVGAIAMVISMIASMVNYKEYVDLLGKNTSWIIAIVVVAIAFLMIIISAIGLLGGFAKNTLLLKIYVATVSVLMVLLIVAGAIAFTYRENAIKHVEENMLENIEVYKPGTEDFETIVWDNIQQNFDCCGVKGYQDWAKYHPSYKTSTTTKKPESCSSEDKKIQYVDGCLEKLSENIRLRHWHIGGAIAGIFLYLLLTIAIACMVIKYINEDEMLIVSAPHDHKGQDNYGMQVKA